MEINEVSFENSLPVTGYGIGFFRIGADIFRGNRFIYKNKIFDWDGFSNSKIILRNSSEIDVLFVGMDTLWLDIRDALKKSCSLKDVVQLKREKLVPITSKYLREFLKAIIFCNSYLA